MLNSDFVMQAARHFAARLLNQSPDDNSRLETLYQIAFGRPVTADERHADLTFLAQVATAQPASVNAKQRRSTAWTTLCHVTLATNEFIYIK